MKARPKKRAPRTNVKVLKDELARVKSALSQLEEAQEKAHEARELALRNAEYAKPEIDSLIALLNKTAQERCEYIQKNYGVIVRVTQTVKVGRP